MLDLIRSLIPQVLLLNPEDGDTRIQRPWFDDGLLCFTNAHILFAFYLAGKPEGIIDRSDFGGFSVVERPPRVQPLLHQIPEFCRFEVPPVAGPPVLCSPLWVSFSSWQEIEAATEPVAFLGGLFARRYLHLLGQVPDLRCDYPKSGTLPFRFPGGCGLLQPLELWDDNEVAAAVSEQEAGSA